MSPERTGRTSTSYRRNPKQSPNLRKPKSRLIGFRLDRSAGCSGFSRQPFRYNRLPGYLCLPTARVAGNSACCSCQDALLFCAALAIAAPAFGQASDPRAAFTNALGQFSLALAGTYGDEGSRIRSGLDAMDRALEQWDAVIHTYEAGMAKEIEAVAPPLAARMRMALGAVYLDRGRLQDALRELTEASRLDATRPENPHADGPRIQPVDERRGGH